ncbi:2-C-methyl-D-erythritol 2,4-cyclodiphosphate synthase [Spiroplasma citri]|uniref:2-C-methyl-D-erythritol 2,4-cyclodiphosphate synthase n=2 Tax=Spiroplasma citri TaxID=2133 RepID=Q14PQ0_SPICI|nr:2-C-methyl-D-erythritol 2,4-cyclodiphosphate synthase [Spiroplasma citri]QED24152.1 2-C-methyl-D-erythritol 2,4-cyclodiphosphate synthase [Spiroplasma citri]QIA68308.1 2-C-methyl-D-erythritol 2,4-cyclodiphosphate synthase [Spiroplasma citri]QIA70184.1 2-C-methyl-D-erythritol 2,4-cyclodiphosphate synthase [Spiroplasma citri]QIA72389.1 2-C-methyl-D-erythritol 2,4-cyclodiphosphate synthase [Spiroplasma citri]QJU61191.1 2-C-methyl-D-erythritol 2,4-cyclodiphosphate synthase [Spiroplasma citri]
MRVGNSYDLHNLKMGTGFYLGGILIPCQYQVEAVSDGDILLHTISEAIIGALGLGDLGEWFDETNKKINSQLILKKALTLMAEQNYQISNIDTTIIIDEPRLQKHKKAIKTNLQKLLQISAEKINLKATTTEQNFPNIIQSYTTLLLLKEND